LDRNKEIKKEELHSRFQDENSPKGSDSLGSLAYPGFGKAHTPLRGWRKLIVRRARGVEVPSEAGKPVTRAGAFCGLPRGDSFFSFLLVFAKCNKGRFPGMRPGPQ